MSAPAAAVEAPRVRRFDNGLTWIHRTVTHNRIVAAELFLPGGDAVEPAERAGVTRLLSAVWVKGTPTRNALQIAQQMESLGAAFGIDAQEDFVAIGGQVIVDNWPQTRALFEDIVFHPTLPADEIEKEREALLNAIRTRHEHIFNVAEERFRRELFGAHPYGRPDEGTEATVRALTREDLVKWHAARLSPRGAVLVTVGPLDTAETEKWVEGLASRWRADAASAPTAAGPVTYPAQSRAVEEKRKFEQGYIMLGFPAAPVTDARYPKIKLINALLGAGMSSPLFTVVREQAGLAYEVSSFYASRSAGSAMVIYAGTDPKNVDLAEKKIHSVLTDFVSRKPTEDELNDAKNLIQGHYLMDHQTNSRIAWYLGWWELLGKGLAYDVQYPADIGAVTAEDLHREAQSLFARPSVTVRVRNGGR